jgi:hypothetical protein
MRVYPASGAKSSRETEFTPWGVTRRFRHLFAPLGTFPAFIHCTGVHGHLRVNVERVDDFDEDVRIGGLGGILDPGPGERIGFGTRDNGLLADFAVVADFDRCI